MAAGEPARSNTGFRSWRPLDVRSIMAVWVPCVLSAEPEVVLSAILKGLRA